MSFALLAVGGVLDRRVAKIGEDDFSKIWAAPRALVTGHDLYDPATWHDTAVDLGTFPPDTTVSLYPPWVALALAPIGLLPLPAATVLWTAGGLLAAGIGLRALLRACLPGRPLAHSAAAATLIVSGPAISTLLSGQWSFLLVGALSLIALSLRSGRGVVAGLASLSMLAKPQLFVFLAPALVLTALWPSSPRAGGRAFVLTTVAGAIALLAVSWLLMPSWWPSWPLHIGREQLTTEHVTISGFLFRELGVPGLVLAPVLMAGAALVALRFDPRSAAWLPVWLALSVALAPYANPYDLTILIVPLVLAAGAARSPRRGDLLFAIGVTVLLIGATLLHDLMLLRYSPIVPATIFVLITVLLWDRRRATAEMSVGLPA